MAYIQDKVGINAMILVKNKVPSKVTNRVAITVKLI